MKKILIPTDFSENAWNAILYATRLFKDFECTFFLLNVYTPVFFSPVEGIPVDVGFEDASRAHSLSELNRLESRIQEEIPNPKHQYSSITSFNLLATEVKNIVEKEAISLIIMGTKGATGAQEVFLGSNTVRVIKSAKDCPVLAIPEGSDFVTPSEIAFATDFKRFYSKNELLPLIDLAKSFNATIRIAYVQQEDGPLTQEQRFNLNMLQKYFDGVKYYQHTLTKSNSVSKSLKLFIEELDIYLLAMLQYKHSFIEKLTKEPIVKRVAFHTQVPFLVIPELVMNSTIRNTKNETQFSKI
ncbi:universal stress protein [Aquimarina sp. 2304DJ70-9]|uniref:universal stress protein n=1 Tax=Aquimarina penaris TaxID=3231044 RepID=UPI003462AD70